MRRLNKGIEMLRTTLFIGVACAALAGCATTFNAVAPGPNGTVFVAGSVQNQAQLWVCPSAGPGECKRVEVETGE